MCLTIVEFLFAIAGIWLIISGKVPEKLFSVLFGKGRYVISPTNARLFGLVLASPIPVVLAVSFFLALLLGEESIVYSVFFETAYMVVIAIASIIVARRIRQPEIE
jgi:hypothetical protein